MMAIGMTSILGICISLLLGFFLWRLTVRAKAKGTGIGENLNEFFIEEFELLLIVILMLCYVAEAMIATAIHPANEQVIDITARFVSHLSINVFGFLASALATKILVDFFMSLKYLSTKKDEKGNIIHESNKALVFVLCFLASVLTFSSFIIPYYNTNIISVGLSRSREFEYAIEQIFFFWKDSQQVAREYGFDHRRSVSEILGYNMMASFVVFIAHLLGSVAEGCIATINSLISGKSGYVGKYEAFLLSKKKGTSKKDEDTVGTDKKKSTGDAKPKPEEKPEEERSNSLYKNIVSIFAKSKEWDEMMIKKIRAANKSLKIEDMQGITSYMNKIQSSLLDSKKKKDKGDLSETEYQSTIDSLKQEVSVFFKKPIPEGLGIDDFDPDED